MIRLIVLVTFLLASAAHAASNRLMVMVPCGSFEEFNKELASIGEQPTATGTVDTALANGAPQVLFYLNKTTKTFTIMIKKGDVACTPVSGTDYKVVQFGDPA
jgi:hypothetical protein